jgi:hypothetical protein
MTKEELDLLQFTSIDMAKFRAGPPKIMRCEVIELQALGTAPDHVPNDVLRDAGSPWCPVTTDSPKD